MSKKQQFETEINRLPFLTIAIGAVLAFLPSIAGCMAFAIRSHISNDTFIIPFIIQAVGSSIMLFGFISAYSDVKRANTVPSGFVLAMTACGVGFVINLLFGIFNNEQRYDLHIDNGDGFPIIAPIIFLLLNVMMAIACFKISRYLTRFKGLAVSFLVLSIVAIGVYILFMLLCSSPRDMTLTEMAINRYEDMEYDYYYESYMTVYRSLMDREASLLLYIILGVSMLTTLIFFWRTLGAKLLKATNASESNDRHEAREYIKDLPDDELLKMTMDRTGLYDGKAILEASMELYRRDSRLLAAQFAALTPDTVAAIASGTAPAPQGIRLAAQKFLNENRK